MSAEEENKDTEMKVEEEKEEAKSEDAEVKPEDAETKESQEAPKGSADKKKEPEKPKEQEADASEETRPKVGAGTVVLNTADATLNVMPTASNKILMPFTEGGFQYLLAGVRATAGIKSGRYMFEVKVIDTHNRGEAQQGSQGRAPMPKQLVRLGLSAAGSSLFLADGGSDCVSIDSEGFFVFEKSRKKVSQKFGRDSTVALLINMDEASPNANTISIFKDGVRVCEPQAIPEKLRGKPLFPTITYKNVTLQVNFGPEPLAPLPFKCHLLASAATTDVEVAEVPKPSDGKYEVVFPVGLPDQGYFDWVDSFLEKNPGYVELSDRKILEWASKSGLWRPKNQGPSNDKPDMKFGIREMDDMSVKRLLSNIAPVACQNFIVPELRANLLAHERKDALSKFALPNFKKTAAVIMGEPTAEYKAKVKDIILAEKKNKVELERKKKAAEEERKRVLEEKKKKAEEARKAAKRKRDGEEEEAKEDEPDEAKEEAKAEDEEVVVQLTDEEKDLTHRKMANPDMTESVLAKSYADFSLPSKEEGFDDITYHWQPEGDVAKLLKDWVFAKKLTQRVEDLKPGDSFKESWSQWQKSIQEWRKLASEWKDPNKRKALLAKRAEAKKKEAEEKGDEAPKEDPEVDVDDLDVFSVDNVSDIGNGEPLFANFVYEDWFLLSTRYEIHLLLHSFKKDLNDSDRPSFTEKDLGFYYNRYFKKAFSLKSYNAKDLAGLVELIHDTLLVNKESSFLEPALSDDTPIANFVKLTEEHRRDRQRRLDAGDETAELKFPRNAPAPPARQPPSGSSWHGGGSGSRPGSAGGGRGPPPHSARQAPSGNGSHYSSRPAYSSSSSAQKRAYTPTGASSYSSKQPRTYGGGGGGGYGGGGGSYYRR